jgi:hypothetical protein
MSKQKKNQLNELFSVWLTKEGLPYNVRNSEALEKLFQVATGRCDNSFFKVILLLN